MTKFWPVLLVAGFCFALPLLAADEPKKVEDPAHEELRTLRKELVEAVNKNDIDGVLKHLDPNVVVIWMNGEISEKPERVKAYYEKMMKGDKRVVESMSTDPDPKHLTQLYSNGTTGVVYGTSNDHFKLMDGKDFVVPSKWTATVVRTDGKPDGKWKIASFQATVNVFENPILSIYVKQMAMWVGIGAAVVGLLLGFIIGRMGRKA